MKKILLISFFSVSAVVLYFMAKGPSHPPPLPPAPQDARNSNLPPTLSLAAEGATNKREAHRLDAAKPRNAVEEPDTNVPPAVFSADSALQFIGIRLTLFVDRLSLLDTNGTPQPFDTYAKEQNNKELNNLVSKFRSARAQDDQVRATNNLPKLHIKSLEQIEQALDK